MAAATSTVAASAKAVSSGSTVVPPASSFAALLRRSRFASYDPAVFQTYTAPPSYASRGNFGLKRPLPASMRYRDKYIAVAAFEHHAHFTDWNNAEAPVRLVKRVEEMGVRPRFYQGNSPRWEMGLGEARTTWLIDSEFAGHVYPDTQAQLREKQEQPLGQDTEDEVPDHLNQPPTSLEGLGKRGRGGYGANRPPPAGSDRMGSYLQPNIEAMSSRQFKRYLERLRTLRPQFHAFLLQEMTKRTNARREEGAAAGEQSSETDADVHEMDDYNAAFALYTASQRSAHRLHRTFLARQALESFSASPETATPQKIEPQPHQYGGLIYSHPSNLDSLLTTKPQPGLVLQHVPKYNTRYEDRPVRGLGDYGDKKQYLALVGGIVSKLEVESADLKKPLYMPDREQPVTFNDENQSEPLADSIAEFRMNNILISTVPRVVSYGNRTLRPKEIMEQIKLEANCVRDMQWAKRNMENPHRPGSYEYTTSLPLTASRHSKMRVSQTGSLFSKAMQKQYTKNTNRAAAAAAANEDMANHEGMISQLKNVITPGRPVQDEDL